MKRTTPFNANITPVEAVYGSAGRLQLPGRKRADHSSERHRVAVREVRETRNPEDQRRSEGVERELRIEVQHRQDYALT